ncbi:hypothetical protein GRJ2_002927000 [Grus japonensis]|uniref:Uncharacterized protein n=1 Tax=Grus japonensis TaxID=30415 RepID=A0ABC9Y3K0_GRUJA
MLAVTNHLLVLHVPEHSLQEDLLHDILIFVAVKGDRYRNSGFGSCRQLRDLALSSTTTSKRGFFSI